MIIACVALMSSIDVKCCEDRRPVRRERHSTAQGTYGVQDAAGYVLPPVNLDEVRAEVLRHLLVGVRPISVRRDAINSAVIRGVAASDINATHYFLILIPDSSFFFKRSACSLSAHTLAGDV